MQLRTPSDVNRLPIPASGEALYFDEGKDRAQGLALRIRAAGSRKFVFFYRLGGRQQKHTIGDAAAWTLDKARMEARGLRVQVDRGENPAIKKHTQRLDDARLFSNIKDEYLAARATDTRPRSLVEYTRHLDKYWKPLHRLPLTAIDRSTVATQLRAIATGSGAVTANRARSTLSTLFGWAIGEGLCEANPVIGTNKAAENDPRSRVLTDAELAAIWRAAPDNGYGRIVRLLMLTAQRRDEIGSLRWPEVDIAAKMIVLPSERTKNHREHQLPLSTAALEVLTAQPRRVGNSLVFGEGEGGYSGWSKSKLELDQTAKLKQPWTLHDLRRTAATRMADLGVAPHIIEAVLNHVSGHKAGVAGIYNRSSYATEKRAALELWGNHIRVIVAQAEGTNVTRLKKATKKA